ncbi:MAG TPA: hypothetical protein PKN96_02705 [Flavobacterium sp.]|uniref:hypothetical protein n=1 Tax=Flavobacterium sp. TaxID=239 RepID=UPI002CADF872|nr:hypothetical protein [Flavobacterium sp.]HNP32185.1 hypothetical protein [Flavobacterium sp.]
MKKSITILVILLAFLFVGCSSESGSTSQNTISGQWKLIGVNGTFAGIHDTFPEGMITWDFNSLNQTVTVTNHNTDPNLFDVLETGVYNYHLLNVPGAPCDESIDINGSVYGCYSVANDSLVIDQSVADGFAIILKH